jgi:hypothetical protein
VRVAFTGDDRFAIADLIRMHGHLFGEGEVITPVDEDTATQPE